MKTILKITIESPDKDKLDIVPEEGASEENYTKEELFDCRENYATDLHTSIVKALQQNLETEGIFEDSFIDDMEELYIEDYNTFSDYKVKILVEEVKNV